jgi:hypothetical protein
MHRRLEERDCLELEGRRPPFVWGVSRRLEARGVSGASGAVDVCFLTAHVWILLAAGWTSQVRFFFFFLTPQTGTV